jgi:hypothetical protein
LAGPVIETSPANQLNTAVLLGVTTPKNTMNRYLSSALFLVACGLQVGCISSGESANGPKEDGTEYNKPEGWDEYWYAGNAEITSYDLKQSRYGEERSGHAVLVFVTEPFSESKQVKLDYPDKNKADNVSVLKLNMTKKFLTGIYPYSLMQSVFTPVSINNYPHTLKTSMSGQEWCGQVYQQLNLQEARYRVNQYSYFESEGDSSYLVPGVFLEDEIWTRIRINPAMLPTGNIEMLPGSFFTRLLHEKLSPRKVLCSLDTTDDELSVYTVKYTEGERLLRIYFESDFPYTIVSWVEEMVNPYGNDKQTTSASIIRSIKTPYWNKNSVKDTVLRDSLYLPIY